MAEFNQSKVIHDWCTLTAFERVVADPCPLASGPRADEYAEWVGAPVTVLQLFHMAKDTLDGWKAAERDAIQNLLLISPTEFAVPSVPPIRNNQDQVDYLVEYWGECFEHRAEAYDWWRGGLIRAPYPEDCNQPEGVGDLLEDIEMEVFAQAEADLQTVLEGGLPKLPYHRGRIFDAIVNHREEWKPKFELRYSVAPEDSDSPENIELTNWASEIEQRWLRLAIGGRLLERWDDPLHVLAYRWEFDWIGQGNWIREAGLAGLRLWCDRLCILEATAHNKVDFQAIESLANLMLPEIRRAFTAEAPSTHLGQSEATLVVTAFPFFTDLPAETRIPEELIKAEWNASSESDRAALENNFGWFALDRRWGAWNHYGSLSGGPELVQSDIVCRALAVRFASRVVEEAARFGREGFENPSKLKDENQAMEFVREVVADVMAFGTSKPSRPVNDPQRFETLCIPPDHGDDSAEQECLELGDYQKGKNSDSDSTTESAVSPLTSALRNEFSGNSKAFHPVFETVADDYRKACLATRKHLELKTWLKSRSPKYFRKIGFALTTIYAAFNSNRGEWWPQLEKELRDAAITLCERTRQRTLKKKPTHQK